MASGDMSQIIANQLKCYACECGPRAGKPHWYKCLSSHQICENCKTTKCKCGEAISKEHCKMTEALLKSNTMRFKCFNQSRGCLEISGEEAMIFHEQECIYRLVKCPRIGCQLKVPFNEVHQHMKDNHIIDKYYSISKGDKQVHRHFAKLNNTYFIKRFPVVFEFDGRTFYSLIRKKNAIIYHWIQFLGSPNEAKNYAYTLEYHANNASQRTNIYTDQVVPVDETSDSIISSFNCFAMPFGMLKAKFMDKKGKFKFSVQIRNLKDDNEESGISDDE